MATDLIENIIRLEDRFAAREPTVLAFVPEPRRFERLRREADALLRLYPLADQRPVLFGELVGVKDIFHADGFVTRAGSQLPVAVLQGAEAVSVTALKAAGALIVGKTVTTEFAYFGAGQTRNPHQMWHTPGGSSSGSAAAVASGLSTLALGTQTIGSINRPAAFCGVVGFKPSHGRISAEGVIPLAPSLDHVGLLAPDVSTVTRGAAVLVTKWRSAETDRLPVLGVPEGPYLQEAAAVGRAQFSADLQQLEAAGYTVKRVPLMEDFAYIRERHLDLMAAEAAQVHADWYAEYGSLYHDVLVQLIERGYGVSAEREAEARAGRTDLRNGLHLAMDTHGIDLWIAPAAPGTAPKGLASTGNPIMNLPWTYAGLPTVNVPCGWHAGLPLGLQLIGRFNSDETLLAWAQNAEAVLQSG
ncbi:MAG: amidase [Anaerolineae bacterium]|nr:amidase [Anaerolineae bacterium]